METFENSENEAPINNTPNLSEILDDETKKLNLLTRAAFKETTLEEDDLVEKIIENSSLDNLFFQDLQKESEKYSSYEEYQGHQNINKDRSWDAIQEKIQPLDEDN